MSKYPPLLHVRIVDDTTGRCQADVDASSTADALAYYLRSRRIADVTEAGVRDRIAASSGRRPGARETLVWESRHPITSALEWAVFAEVHGP